NSLAETYAYGGSDADRAQALESFEAALRLREEEGVGDLAGRARTHGGLGRLFYFAPEPDLERARDHFRTNLAICEEIGERKGQCAMNSFLGRCDRDEGKWESALEHYRASFRLAESRLDRVFAGAGRLESLGELEGPAGELEATGLELVELTADDGIPSFAWADIRRALKSAAQKSEWWRTLNERATAVR
ncbi:MAG: hypothetical protein OER88_04480, partial [Planctomycetota bacterium]|nr:hypothetical protein [Planctomycetota bacterium]